MEQHQAPGSDVDDVVFTVHSCDSCDSIWCVYLWTNGGVDDDDDAAARNAMMMSDGQ